MTIHARQIALAQRLFSVKNEDFIKYLEQIFDEIEKENPLLNEEELKGIKIAIEQVKNGEHISLEDAAATTTSTHQSSVRVC